jgi:hypothetical protein
MEISYSGLTVGKNPTTSAYQEPCANSTPTMATVIQKCTKKISDLIYPDDEVLYIFELIRISLCQ